MTVFSFIKALSQIKITLLQKILLTINAELLRIS